MALVIKGEYINSIWSDMMIETTYMEFARVQGEIIGGSTQPRTAYAK